MKTVILWLLIVLAVILLIVKNTSFSEVEDRLDRGAMALVDKVDDKLSLTKKNEGDLTIKDTQQNDLSQNNNLIEE